MSVGTSVGLAEVLCDGVVDGLGAGQPESLGVAVGVDVGLTDVDGVPDGVTVSVGEGQAEDDGEVLGVSPAGALVFGLVVTVPGEVPGVGSGVTLDGAAGRGAAGEVAAALLDGAGPSGVTSTSWAGTPAAYVAASARTVRTYWSTWL